MVRASRIHKIFEHSHSDTPGSVIVNSGNWGRWSIDEVPHVCGVCKPVLDDYLFAMKPHEVISRWPGAICLTCGWVPRIDPSRKRCFNLGMIMHGI